AGCWSCHHGPNFTDGEFHNILVPSREPFPSDPGRYMGVELLVRNDFHPTGPYSDAPKKLSSKYIGSLTQTPEMWGQFKTPTLRNVARTSPYMHQGQFGTLREVLEYYSTLKDAALADHHQEHVLMPLNLSDSEIQDIIAFLESLTDETRTELVR